MSHLSEWRSYLMRYQHSHPNLSLKECMIEASKTYKKKKHGGNPLAVAEVVTGGVNAISGLANSLGDQIDKGRRTTRELDRETGKVNIEKNKNLLDYFRDLKHKRFWDQDYLPNYLKLERTHTNNPKYKAEQERKDELLWQYAQKTFGGCRKK